MKRVCAMCEQPIREEPLVFACGCGISFYLTIVETYPNFFLCVPELPTRPTFEQASRDQRVNLL